MLYLYLLGVYCVFYLNQKCVKYLAQCFQTNNLSSMVKTISTIDNTFCISSMCHLHLSYSSSILTCLSSMFTLEVRHISQKLIPIMLVNYTIKVCETFPFFLIMRVLVGDVYFSIRVSNSSLKLLP